MSDIIVKKNNEEQYITKTEDGKILIPNNLYITSLNKNVLIAKYNEPKISEIQDKNIVVSQIHGLVNRTVMDKGVNVEPEDLVYLQERVETDIMNEFTRFPYNYTLKEIELAFYYGVRNNLGDYFGINPVTFYSWLVNYNTLIRIPADRELIKKIAPPKIDEDAENKKRIYYTILIYKKLMVDYNLFLKTGHFTMNEQAFIYYLFLNKLGILEYDANEYEMSRLRYEEYLKSAKGKKDVRINEGIAYLKALNNFMQGGYGSKIKEGAMKIAIHRLFSNCKSGNIDLKKIIWKKHLEYEDKLNK